uniref:UMP-CMP kinase n=1 Tax=Xenopsylla cheopis TaxID=163159 RepID=A0A6M2DY03_XENCH
MSQRVIGVLEKAVKMLPQVVFVLGGPGSGKGTQCQKIANEFGFVHLSAGELLRQARCDENAPHREIIDDCIVTGKIVPVAVTCSLLEEAMKKSGKSKFLIDGFPRNYDNLEGWNASMSDKVKLLFVLFFECSEEVCTQRCLARGNAGSGRTDDNLESLKKRFETHMNHTMPIINHYEKMNLVHRINAMNSVDEIFNNVKTVIQKTLAESGDF